MFVLLSHLILALHFHLAVPVDDGAWLDPAPPATVTAPAGDVASVARDHRIPSRDDAVPPAPASPAPAAPPAPRGPVAPDQCQAGEEFQGEFGCVAVQLPGETTGRAYG